MHLVIGASCHWSFIDGYVVWGRGESEAPGTAAMSSKLGFILSGPDIVGADKCQTTVNLNASGTHVLKVDTLVCHLFSILKELSKFWTYESLHINPEEKHVHEKFEGYNYTQRKLNTH